MSQLVSQFVILKLGKGDWQQGFPQVTAQLWDEEAAVPAQVTGSLPPAPELPQIYAQWQSLYQGLSRRLGQAGLPTRKARGLEILSGSITHVSEADFQDLCQQLKRCLNLWLGANSFGKIERLLRTKLVQSAAIRIVIETEVHQIRQFPWHLWNFLEDYPNAEVALATPDHGRVSGSPQKSDSIVKILAILGDSQGINVQADRTFLEQLPGARTVFLVEPPRWELNNWIWNEEGWDVLFFAGHSISRSDGATGEIALNQTETLTIEQLKHALKAAIARGLKLAIFNSCDGLGLARAMADLNIPQLIVMREPVPDQVAQAFLKHLLTAFSGGKSLYQAVREARERLQGMEGQFPCASWLPVIVQNPSETPPTWKELRDGLNRESGRVAFGRSLRAMLLASAAVLAIVGGLRYTGQLEPLELEAYDQLMQLRPPEPTDDRLLIITVPPQDVQAQPEKQGSLSNRALSQLLEKLEQYKPAVIGVDIFREYPVESQFIDLRNRLQQDDRLITICYASGEADPNRLGEYPDIAPAAEIPRDKFLRIRVGFNNSMGDEPDGTIRRHLIRKAFSPQTACQVDMSLGYLVALRYLLDRGVQFTNTKAGDPQLGNVVLKRLQSDAGGYHQVDTRGDQILINYRAVNPIAPTLSLNQVLNEGKLSRELVAGKIVLIGSTDLSYGDHHLTPYSRGITQKTPGVMIVAQGVSQIISTVLDKRPLIWWLPKWGEILWIWGWSLFGGVIAWQFRSLSVIGIVAGGGIALLYGCCYGLLLFWGAWVPLVPSALALVAVGGAVASYKIQREQRS